MWKNAQTFMTISELVELANGGADMAFYHYGSNGEYHKMLANVRSDTRLNSLAYVGAAMQWLNRAEARDLQGQDSAMTD